MTTRILVALTEGEVSMIRSIMWAEAEQGSNARLAGAVLDKLDQSLRLGGAQAGETLEAFRYHAETVADDRDVPTPTTRRLAKFHDFIATAFGFKKTRGEVWW